MSEPSLEPLPEGIAERFDLELPAHGQRLVTVLFSLTRAARGLSWNPDFTALLLAKLDDLA
jgi:hypothetical protein